MKKQILLIVPLMLLSGLTGWYLAGVNWPSKEPSLDSDVLAIVNNEVISKGDYVTQMKIRGGSFPGQYQDLKQKQVLLDFLVNQKLLLAQAEAQGIDQDPVVKKVYHQAVIDKYLEINLNKKLAEIRVPESEVKQHFENNKKSYNRPARRRGAIIFKKTNQNMTESQLSELRTELLAIKDQTNEMPNHITHFGDLARKHSDDGSSKYQGGVIGWLIESPKRAYKWPQNVVKALFELPENGSTSDIIQTDKGLYLVRVVGSENVVETEYERIASGIKQKILSEKQIATKKEFLNSIKDDAKIQINQDLLASIEAINDAPKDNNKQPPAMPVKAGVQP